MSQENPKTTEPTTTTTTNTTHQPTSTSDLMSSAKTVAEAAQAAATQQTDKIDKAKVAGASEDLLEATKTYGKLDDKSGVGQCVDKAEGYLHQMHSSDPTAGAAETGGDSGEKEKSSGGDSGGFMKMAKGLFKK